MKSTYSKILKSTVIASFFLSSCSDSYLDENYNTIPLTVLDQNAIKTKQDLVDQARGLYSTMSATDGFGDFHFIFQELGADLAFVSNNNSGRYVGTNGGTYLVPEGEANSGIWRRLYTTVANANFMLSYEGKIHEPSNPDSYPSVNKIFGHAKAVRAYNLLTLLMYFSPNYGEGDQTLGIVLPKKFDTTQTLPRSTVNESVAFIEKDLKEALAAFNPPENSEDNSTTELYSNHNSFNSGSVNLLLARLYLYKKDYNQALAYAKKVYNDPESTLLPRTEVASFFASYSQGEPNPETLFQVEYNKVSTQILLDTWGTGGAYKQNFMSRDFWNTFPTTDIRKSTWYTSNNVVMGTNYSTDNPRPIDVRKYLTSERDIVHLRKSESVFIMAEAQYYLGTPDVAFTTLKTWVKGYRDTGYNLNLTGTAVLDEILRQKGFEFFLEGMRLNDMKRNHKDIKKMQPGLELNIPVGDRRWVWPIPILEIRTNSKMVQAPGY